MNFADLPTTRKGTAGERIVKAHLERIGKEVYTPAPGQSHTVDYFTLDRSTLQVTGLDVKTYPRRYIDDSTGIDRADFVRYLGLERGGTPVLILFVDSFERAIYGATIGDLDHLAVLERDKVYFPLSAMELVRGLTIEELEQIGGVKDSHRYEKVTPYFEGEIF